MEALNLRLISPSEFRSRKAVILKFSLEQRSARNNAFSSAPIKRISFTFNYIFALLEAFNKSSNRVGLHYDPETINKS